MHENPNEEDAYCPTTSCKDSFRYRLVGENGRYRFVSVKFVGAEGCAAEELHGLAAMLQGKWLDEVDVEALAGMPCRGGRDCGCPQEVARMVAEIRETLAT
jgi:hypothetical protein